MQFRAEMVPIFRQVVQLRDRYGLHAYLTAIENGDLRGKLEAQLQNNTKIMGEQKGVLLKVLQTGAMPLKDRLTTQDVLNPAGLRQ